MARGLVLQEIGLTLLFSVLISIDDHILLQPSLDPLACPSAIATRNVVFTRGVCRRLL
jgi:hypothetical protein